MEDQQAVSLQKTTDEDVNAPIVSTQTDEPLQMITIIGRRPNASRDRGSEIAEKTVDISHVRRGFASFLQNLKAIIDVDVPTVDPFELEEVQFSAEISAEGEFKLLGTGVGIEATSGVTFTLRRKREDNKT